MDYTIINSLVKKGSFYIYDTDAMYQSALNIQAGAANVFYACKANPLSSILLLFHSAGMHFDISSEGELRQVLSLGISGKKISITGPAKSEKLIRLGLENEVASFVIESPFQLDLIESLAREFSYKPNILLRLQLKLPTLFKTVSDGNDQTAFGMDEETAKKMLNKMTLPFLGFHVFQWSNILSIDSLYQIWVDILVKCKKLTSDFHVLDVGGGIGIPYNQGDLPLVWSKINDKIAELKETYQLNEFRLEMGRYLTGPFGVYITSVIDIKNIHGQNFIVLEGGINHMLMPKLSNRIIPIELLRKSQSTLAPFKIHGPLCTKRDNLGLHFLPNDIIPGDVLVFKQIGAYGFTYSMPFFLSHDLPGEAIIKNGALNIIRKPAPASVWMK